MALQQTFRADCAYSIMTHKLIYFRIRNWVASRSVNCKLVLQLSSNIPARNRLFSRDQSGPRTDGFVSQWPPHSRLLSRRKLPQKHCAPKQKWYRPVRRGAQLRKGMLENCGRTMNRRAQGHFVDERHSRRHRRQPEADSPHKVSGGAREWVQTEARKHIPSGHGAKIIISRNTYYDQEHIIHPLIQWHQHSTSQSDLQLLLCTCVPSASESNTVCAWRRQWQS